MKMKYTALLICLLTATTVGLAQDNSGSPPAPAPAPDAAPAEASPASPAPAAPAAAATNDAPAAAVSTNAIAAATPAATPAAPGEAVPLIVIDEVPLTDAIRNLARQSNLNFQFDPRVTSSNQPTVSIRFENVTAEEALTAVLDNYNLQLSRDPRSKIARVTLKDPKAEEPLFSQIVQLKYSDPTNMIALVKSTLSARSVVMADVRTGQLLVTTTRKEIDGVIALIEKLDTPTKQVLIETRLIETAHAPNSIKGIDWSGTLEAQNFRFGNNLYEPAPLDSLNNLVTKTAPKLLVDTGGGFNPGTAFLNADGVAGVLSFINKDTDTEVLATPRAVTMDNQTARLEITRAYPIFTITPGSANSPAGSTITYSNVGVILQVTPKIAADNNISLRVVPEVSNIDGKDSQKFLNDENTANIYAIRRIETSVMIPSGNTLVMGGLIHDTKTKAYTKVPLLGDLPGVGLAFRSENKKRTKQNLMIFITPTIIDDEAFHLSSSGADFLKTQVTDTPEPPESAWDSAKPHDWSKPVY